MINKGTIRDGDAYSGVTPYIDPNDAIEMASEIYEHTGERITIPERAKNATRKSAWRIADEKKWGQISEGEMEARNNVY